MMILLFAIALLTYWSGRLLLRAYNQRELSLVFASTLVALSGAGLIAAYMLMDGCIGYLGHSSATLPPSLTTAYTEEIWVPFTESKTGFDALAHPYSVNLSSANIKYPSERGTTQN